MIVCSRSCLFSCSDVYIQVVYSSSSSSYRVVLNPLRIPIFPDLAPVFPLQRSSSESSSYLSFLVGLRVMAAGRAFDNDRSPLGRTPGMSVDTLRQRRRHTRDLQPEFESFSRKHIAVAELFETNQPNISRLITQTWRVLTCRHISH